MCFKFMNVRVHDFLSYIRCTESPAVALEKRKKLKSLDFSTNLSWETNVFTATILSKFGIEV